MSLGGGRAVMAQLAVYVALNGAQGGAPQTKSDSLLS